MNPTYRAIHPRILEIQGKNRKIPYVKPLNLDMLIESLIKERKIFTFDKLETIKED